MITSKCVQKDFEDLDKLIEIYNEAFPPRERVLTIPQMLRLTFFKKEIMAYYDGDTLIGLSIVACLKKFDYLLFYAMRKDLRSKGYGGQIFDSIVADRKDKPLVFAIEDPSEECENKEQRIKREAFYLKHNCVHTGYKGKMPIIGPIFLLMCATKHDDWSFIGETISKIPFGRCLISRK